MDRKKANAIFKGSLMIMTVLLWEGSGICKNPYPVWASDESARYGQYGTFDTENSEAAGEIGTFPISPAFQLFAIWSPRPTRTVM